MAVATKEVAEEVLDNVACYFVGCRHAVAKTSVEPRPRPQLCSSVAAAAEAGRKRTRREVGAASLAADTSKKAAATALPTMMWIDTTSAKKK